MEFTKGKYIQLSGELFTDVQMSRIFSDSKVFVDSVPKINPEKIFEMYKKEKKSADFNLLAFVRRNFYLPKDQEIKLDLSVNRDMQQHIKYLWQILKRDAPEHLELNSTLIPIPKPYIIPGGRFREIYYWDSYFTMLGLYVDGEVETIENMIENFVFLIDKFGFIPNGNRVYYLSRSQPPFLSLMVNLLCEIKQDYNLGIKFLPQLESEYNFWCGLKSDGTNSERTVQIENGKELCRYFDFDVLPREESFFEDVHAANNIKTENRKEFYRNIRAACESGWDFSSRWFKDGKSLASINTTDLIPIDLNSLIYFNETFISKLNDLAGNKVKSKNFSDKAGKRSEIINEYLWNRDEKFYFDYDFKERKNTSVYSLAASYPLFFKIADKKNANEVRNKIEKYFLKDGGVITTINYTGQQWDAPNGWAPLQWITVKGLRNYGFDELADKIKKRWLNLNQNVFSRTNKMFEKYNVDDISLHAGGGEYPLQDGFGWTNGVASALLNDLDKSLN